MACQCTKVDLLKTKLARFNRWQNEMRQKTKIMVKKKTKISQYMTENPDHRNQREFQLFLQLESSTNFAQN